jgi:hypothetical protein
LPGQLEAGRATANREQGVTLVGTVMAALVEEAHRLGVALPSATEERP